MSIILYDKRKMQKRFKACKKHVKKENVPCREDIFASSCEFPVTKNMDKR